MNNFSWQTLEYPHKERGSDWYWTVGIITVALVVTSVIFGNFLFGIVLAIAVFTLTLFTLRKPRTISVSVSEKGIVIDKTLFPFNSLDAFGIDETNPSGVQLFLKSKKMIIPLTSISVVYEDIDALREFLSKHLREETFQRGLLETLIERLGF